MVVASKVCCLVLLLGSLDLSLVFVILLLFYQGSLVSVETF